MIKVEVRGVYEIQGALTRPYAPDGKVGTFGPRRRIGKGVPLELPWGRRLSVASCIFMGSLGIARPVRCLALCGKSCFPDITRLRGVIELEWRQTGVPGGFREERGYLRAQIRGKP